MEMQFKIRFNKQKLNCILIKVVPICEKCPACGSDDVIPWDDGCICRDCGHEW